MVLFKLLIFTLTFYDSFLIVDSRRICPKGHQVTRYGAGCETCTKGYFQPTDNDSQYCKPCTTCDENSGSVVKEQCTAETNTKCQCRGEFVPLKPDSSTCKCDTGFESKHGECSKCKDGYFSTRINSACQKWKECKCGVSKNGNNTSDVICNAERCSDASETFTTTPPTSNKIVSLITHLTSHHPHDGGRTPRTTTTAAQGHPNKVQPSLTSTNYIGTGTALIILIIIGLLVVLTAVTCKLHITRQPAIPKNDSLCRRPVEESGDGSQSSLKLNPGEH